MYEISVDRSLRLVRVRIVGLLDADQAAQYEQELKLHILGLSDHAREFDLLVDLREAQVISQQDTKRLQDRMQWHIDQGLRRSAHIITSVLLQMQTRRLAPDTRFNYFLTEEDAMAWLGE